MKRIAWVLVIVGAIVVLAAAWSTCQAQVAPFVVVQTQSIDTTNLKAVWEMDEASNQTRNDSHHANHLTDSAASVVAVTGLIGNAASFDAVSTDLLYRDDCEDLSMGTTTITITAWVYHRHTGAATRTIAAKYVTSNYEYLAQIRSNATLDSLTMISYYRAVNGIDTGPWFAATDSQWVFCVFTYSPDGDSMSVYANNGIGDSTITPITSGLDGTAAFYVGKTSPTTTTFYRGFIDQMTLWKRALTVAEIAYLYNNGSGRAYSAWSKHN